MMKCVICDEVDVDLEVNTICEDCLVEIEEERSKDRKCLNCGAPYTRIYIECGTCEKAYYVCGNDECLQKLANAETQCTCEFFDNGEDDAKDKDE